jgi:hypothetical protein
MIAKAGAMTASQKSSIGRLVSYLMEERDQTKTGTAEIPEPGPEKLVAYMTGQHVKAERVGATTITNCGSTDPAWAAAEMAATQKRNTRAQSDKTFHLMIAFRPNEQPSPETLKVIEARFADALGYAEHQRISVVHHDTAHLHIHVAINKIHPTRFTFHEPLRFHRILARTCVALEKEFGLEPSNHEFARDRAAGRAADMSTHTGIANLIEWIKTHCREELERASNWHEFQRVLQENDLLLKPRGNGYIFVAGDGTACKASSVSRSLSKQALEQRLGPMPDAIRLAEQSATAKAKPLHRTRKSGLAVKGHNRNPRARAAVRTGSRTPLRSYRPVPANASKGQLAQFEQYQREREQDRARKERERTAARAEMERRIAMARDVARLERAMIRSTCTATEARIAYLAIQLRTATAIDQARRDYRNTRHDLQTRYPGRSWRQWQRETEKAQHAQKINPTRGHGHDRDAGVER